MVCYPAIFVLKGLSNPLDSVPIIFWMHEYACTLLLMNLLPIFFKCCFVQSHSVAFLKVFLALKQISFADSGLARQKVGSYLLVVYRKTQEQFLVRGNKTGKEVPTISLGFERIKLLQPEESILLSHWRPRRVPWDTTPNESFISIYYKNIYIPTE